MLSKGVLAVALSCTLPSAAGAGTIAYDLVFQDSNGAVIGDGRLRSDKTSNLPLPLPGTSLLLGLGLAGLYPLRKRAR